MTLRSVARLALPGCLLTAALLVVAPAGAQAACSGTAAPSAYGFTGLVTQVRDEGTLARVLRDDGGVVVVRSEPGPDARRYAVGGRYGFQPTTASSPFSDNACTRTRQLSGPAYTPSMNTPDPGPLPRIVIGVLVVAGVLVAPRLARRIRRGRVV